MLKISQFPALLALALASVSVSEAQAQALPPGVVVDNGPIRPIVIRLDAVPKGVLVQMLMRDVMRVPYLIDSSVLQDRSPVSINLEIPRDDVPLTVVRFLRSLGLVVGMQGGTVIVSGVDGPSGLRPSLPGQVTLDEPGGVPGISQRVLEPRSFAVFRPVHRLVSDLSRQISAAFPGLDLSGGSRVSDDQTTVQQLSADDVLVLAGPSDQVEVALQLAQALDAPRPIVALKILVLEVRTEKTRGSALQVLSDALAAVAPSSYASIAPGPQSLAITIGGVSAVASAVREDGRFHIVAEPSLSVESGGTASLSAGSKVPTLGGVTFGENGQVIRSVEYQDSGLLLSVVPTVLGDRVHLRLRQERSSFAPTSTGVNDSPTLDQATVSTVFHLQAGASVAIAGVNEVSDNSTRRGIFGGLLRARSRSETSRELVIVVEAAVENTPASEPIQPQLFGPLDVPASSSS